MLEMYVFCLVDIRVDMVMTIHNDFLNQRRHLPLGQFKKLPGELPGKLPRNLPGKLPGKLPGELPGKLPRKAELAWQVSR